MKKMLKLWLSTFIAFSIIVLSGCQTLTDPTSVPTEAPVEMPTVEPTEVPVTPTDVPVVPTAAPTETPVPTEAPVVTETPVATPTEVPTVEPTEVPTVTPTSTPTPLPTATPTPEPTATPTPTPKVECKHEETFISIIEETETEYKFQEACDECGTVIDEFTKPKATPTPTPKPTEKPLPTPTPMAEKEVLRESVDEDGNTNITYTDRTSTTIWAEGKCPTVDAGKDETPICYKTHWAKKQGKFGEISYITSEEYLARFDFETSEDEVIEYYIYYYFDGETDTWTSRLVNSDGSFNRLSEKVVNGFVKMSQTIYGYKYESGWYLKSIDLKDSTIRESILLTPDDFIYHEDGVIRLYDH